MKNKSIILHYFARKTKVSYYITLQTLLRTFFVRPLLCWNCNSNVETVKLNTEQFSKWRRRTDVSYGFQRNASLHANKMFCVQQNAIADELPNIQFSLTTVRDTSLPGIQTFFIYSPRIISRPPWISIEKFGLSSKFGLYSLRINGKPLSVDDSQVKLRLLKRVYSLRLKT